MPPMDDDLWDLVWERQMTFPERNAIVRAVWFGRPHSDLFEARIGAELARRWRRRAVWIAVQYVVWTLLWGWIHLDDLRRPPRIDPPVPLMAVSLGLLVIAGCIYVHRRMGRRPLPARR